MATTVVGCRHRGRHRRALPLGDRARRHEPVFGFEALARPAWRSLLRSVKRLLGEPGSMRPRRSTSAPAASPCSTCSPASCALRQHLIEHSDLSRELTARTAITTVASVPAHARRAAVPDSGSLPRSQFEVTGLVNEPRPPTRVRHGSAAPSTRAATDVPRPQRKEVAWWRDKRCPCSSIGQQWGHFDGCSASWRWSVRRARTVKPVAECQEARNGSARNRGSPSRWTDASAGDRRRLLRIPPGGLDRRDGTAGRRARRGPSARSGNLYLVGGGGGPPGAHLLRERFGRQVHHRLTPSLDRDRPGDRSRPDSGFS